jgi:hypothetical protein
MKPFRQILKEGLISDKDIKDAKEELSSKSDHQVEKETAIKWAARYLAAKTMKGRDADNFKHESLEHAALSGKEIYNKIIKQIGQAK